MIGVLVGGGSTAAAATAATLGWRLVSHWLPVVGGTGRPADPWRTPLGQAHAAAAAGRGEEHLAGTQNEGAYTQESGQHEDRHSWPNER